MSDDIPVALRSSSDEFTAADVVRTAHEIHAAYEANPPTLEPHPDAPPPPPEPRFAGSRSGVVYELVPVGGRGASMLRRTDRTWTPPKAVPSRSRVLRPPSIREQIRAAATPEAVAEALLEASRKNAHASDGTRAQWRRTANARLEQLERERLIPDASPRVTLS